MQAYLAKRVILIIPTIILLTIIVFLVLRIVPGDPAIMMLMSSDLQESYTKEDLDRVRKLIGTDKPIYVQYGKWVWNMLQVDFGTSFHDQTPVSDDLKQRIPITLELTIMAVLWASILAVPLGVISAIKQDSIGDYASRIITIAGIALPNFVVAILMIFFLVRWFGWLPPIGYENLWDKPGENLQQLLFPAIALGFSNMAFIGRVTRSAMLEVFREDYIRTARSKGLAEQVVVYRHALKNALLPVITVSGYEFGRLLAGTVIIEVIFGIPGMGRLLLDAVVRRDFPTVQAIVILMGLIVVVLNVVLDLLYAWLNPRIHYT